MSPLAAARLRAKTAYGVARGDSLMAAVYDRWWSETLLAIDGRPDAARVELLRRTAALFELLVDRRTWLR